MSAAASKFMMDVLSAMICAAVCIFIMVWGLLHVFSCHRRAVRSRCRLNACVVRVRRQVNKILFKFALHDTTDILGPVIRRAIAENLKDRGINAKQ